MMPRKHTHKLYRLCPDKFLTLCTKISLTILTELYKDVLGFVQRNLLEVLANKDLDRLGIPVIGDLFRHQVGLKIHIQAHPPSVHAYENKMVTVPLNLFQ